jgi:hypothetical protein
MGVLWLASALKIPGPNISEPAATEKVLYILPLVKSATVCSKEKFEAAGGAKTPNLTTA